jgi:hypothetical protein
VNIVTQNQQTVQCEVLTDIGSGQRKGGIVQSLH